MELAVSSWSPMTGWDWWTPWHHFKANVIILMIFIQGLMVQLNMAYQPTKWGNRSSTETQSSSSISVLTVGWSFIRQDPSPFSMLLAAFPLTPLQPEHFQFCSWFPMPNFQNILEPLSALPGCSLTWYFINHSVHLVHKNTTWKKTFFTVLFKWITTAINFCQNPLS